MRDAVLLLLAAMFFLAQCSASPLGPPAPSPAAPTPPLISEEAARQRAIEVAAMGGPEIEAAQEAPQLRSLTRTTWQEAQANYYDGDSPSISGRDPALEVWVAELTGEWWGGMLVPEITPTPARYTSAVIILDARTGETITAMYRP